MIEPDQTNAPPDSDAVAPSVASSVREIVAAAERSAASIRQEVEGSAARRASQLEADAKRRADEMLAAADMESQHRLAAAEVRADQYLAECRRLIDEFAEERTRRLTAVSDSLIAFSEAIKDRFEAAETVRAQTEELIARLGRAARELARESDETGGIELNLPDLPDLPDMPESPGPGLEETP